MQILAETFTLKNNRIQLLYKKGLKKNTKNILFLAVMHGEEPQGEELLKRFIEEIKVSTKKFNNLYFITCLNPDGRDLKQRGNSNNVDLNRNFNTENYEVTTFDDGTTSGTHAGSEIETQFLTRIINKCEFDVILTIHAPFKIVNFDGPAEKIAEKISKLTGYPLQKDIGYPTPGSFGTYCGVERDIPIITLELPEDDIDILWKTIKPILQYLAEES